jgi:hypothetical protein
MSTPRYYIPDEIDIDYIENICLDVKLAFEDYLDNEYSEEGYERVLDAIKHLNALLDTLTPDSSDA